ncbi:MAG: GNAT family N-acetyltransferase [Candidatus Marinimicrobia bacterium]|nr:GNAT family N-acetyltransferase [Candidatus Neomarinimicrobiota bacterium]
MEFKEELQGKRLVLRQTRPTQEMAALIFKAVDANREHLRPFSSWEKNDDSVESCLKYLKDKEPKTETGDRVEYGIFIKDQNTYIGNIQVFDISKENRSGEFGYWLAEKATGNGYMREAVGILEKECFISLNLNRIQITCNALNKASIRVIKACGYSYEGTLREERYEEYQAAICDTMVFSKLRSEYNEK